MLIGCNKGNVSKLVLQINTKGLDSVSHWIAGSYSRQVLEEMRDYSNIGRFITVVIIIRAMLLWNLISSVLRRLRDWLWPSWWRLLHHWKWTSRWILNLLSKEVIVLSLWRIFISNCSCNLRCLMRLKWLWWRPWYRLERSLGAGTRSSSYLRLRTVRLLHCWLSEIGHMLALTDFPYRWNFFFGLWHIEVARRLKNELLDCRVYILILWFVFRL